MNGNPEDITIISRGVKLDGKITSDGSIRIDGQIEGDVNCKGNVTIGEMGEVKGQVNADMVTIGGKVTGSVTSKERLVLESNANLKGNLITKILVIEAGAKFEGKSSMESNRNETFKPASSTQSNENGSK